MAITGTGGNPVICNETGERFENQKAACRWVHPKDAPFDKSLYTKMSQHLNGLRDDVYGYTFTKLKEKVS